MILLTGGKKFRASNRGPDAAVEDGAAVDSTAEDGTVEDGNGAAELSKTMVDGPAESHDNPVNTITMDGAELES